MNWPIVAIIIAVAAVLFGAESYIDSRLSAPATSTLPDCVSLCGTVSCEQNCE